MDHAPAVMSRRHVCMLSSNLFVHAYSCAPLATPLRGTSTAPRQKGFRSAAPAIFEDARACTLSAHVFALFTRSGGRRERVSRFDGCDGTQAAHQDMHGARDPGALTATLAAGGGGGRRPAAPAMVLTSKESVRTDEIKLVSK